MSYHNLTVADLMSTALMTIKPATGAHGCKCLFLREPG